MTLPARRFVVAVLATLPQTVVAQDVRVGGRLLDATTNTPVAAATIEIVDLRRSTLTDSLGRFFFTGVEPGRRTLRVMRVGYGTHEQAFVVGAAHLELAVRISPRAIELETLTVTAAAREASATSAAYVISREEIESVLPRARNLGDVVRSFIPGTNVYETRAGYVCLEFRGARGSRTRGCNFPLVVVDDVPIPGPAQFLRDTPPEDIERIEFVPASAGAARYGADAQYGALVIRTRRSALAERPERRPADAASPPASYPAYQWRQEGMGPPWERTVAGAAAGNLVGLGIGLAALGCLSGDEGNCVTRQSFGSGLAALLLPIAGTTLGANLFGRTEQSRGRPLPVALAAALPIVVGYAMYRDGETAGFGGSRVIGGAFVVALSPLAATIADGLFRRPR